MGKNFDMVINYNDLSTSCIPDLLGLEIRILDEETKDETDDLNDSAKEEDKNG